MIAASWRRAAVPAGAAAAAIAATELLARLQPGSAPYGPVGATVTALAAAAWGRRHRRPVASMVAVTLLTTGYLVAGYAFGPIQVFVVMSSFALARRRPVAEVALVCATAAALL